MMADNDTGGGSLATLTEGELIDRAAKARMRAEVAMLESLFDWDDFGGADQFDRIRSRDADGTTWRPISLPSDRRNGSNWPLWRTEQDLAELRARSQMTAASNGYARGLIRNLCNYTIGKGFTYSAVPKDQNKRKAGVQADEGAKLVAEAVQAVVDDFLSRNNWNSTGDPQVGMVAPSTREREAYRRVQVDGEAFLRFFFQDDGCTYVRFVEAACIRNPPGGTVAEGWSFGIQHQVEPFSDIETRLAYFVAYKDPIEAGQQPSAKSNFVGDRVEAEHIVHIRGMDEDSAVKRGVPALSWDVVSALERASKLQRNESLSAAIQAATAEIWQHASGTASQISSMATGLAERQITNPVTQRVENVDRIAPGSVRRIPQGQTLVPKPGGSGAGERQVVLQADLRLASAAFSAPEYMTGDASNANYASTKEAGTPFVVGAAAEQEHYKTAFLVCVWKAVKHAVRCGKLPTEALTLVAIQCEAPSVLTKNPTEAAQANQIEIASGTLSPQTAMMAAGRDPEVEMKNMVEWKEMMGGGDGVSLPIPPESSGANP